MKQNERVLCSKSNSEGKFAAWKLEVSATTEQINIDLDNNFWLDPLFGIENNKMKEFFGTNN